MGVIVAVANQKGGCGKTTTAIHFSLALAARQHQVLLIDLDPQGHAGLGLGVTTPTAGPTLSEILAHTPLTGVGPSLSEAVVAARPSVDVVPANLALAGLEQQLATAPGREERLAEHLADLVSGWDVIVIDCPPSLGLLTANALVAAREVIVPFEPSTFALHGVERLMATIDLVRERTGHACTPRLLPVMVSPRDYHARAMLMDLRDERPGQLLQSQIRHSILFARAAAKAQGIGEIAKRARAWKDYLDAAAELDRLWQDAHAILRPRFAGLRAVPGGVTYSHPDLGPTEIQLAGDFNGWEPDADVELTLGERDTWQKLLKVRPGRYEYKFVFGDRWLADPANPRRIGNSLGTENSVIEVLDVPPRQVAPSRVAQRAGT